MDDESMWAADRVVALTPGSAITIPKTTNEFAIKEIQAFSQHENNSLIDAWLRMKEMLINFHGHNLSKDYQLLEDIVLLKLDWAKNQKTKPSLKKTVAFTDEGSSNFDTDKIMARMDAMTMKMDDQFVDKQSGRPSGSLPSNTQSNLKAENMLVEVGNFTFLSDLVILKMEEDSKVSLILGRPFLYTDDTIIRVKQKQLNLGVGTERMIFNIDSTIKHSYSNDDTCFSIDVINEILEEDFDALLDEGSEILHSIEGTILEEKLFAEFDEFMAMTTDENSESESDTEEPPIEKITFKTDYKIKTSLEVPPMDLELKPLPDNLESAFLEEPLFFW
ncbi:reverse transcriptase domain-containing protein [Tanacetum coccineum]